MFDLDMRDSPESDKWHGPYGAMTPEQRLNNHYAEANDPSSVKHHDLGAMDTNAAGPDDEGVLHDASPPRDWRLTRRASDARYGDHAR